MTGLYFNTAAVIDADGKYLGKYRKHHIRTSIRASGKSFTLLLEDLGYPTFTTKYAQVGVYICYDRIFRKAPASWAARRGDCLQPVGHRRGTLRVSLGTRATGARRREWILCRRDQPRRHREAWNIGEFYGKSYFCNPRGKIVAQASRDKTKCWSPISISR